MFKKDKLGELLGFDKKNEFGFGFAKVAAEDESGTTVSFRGGTIKPKMFCSAFVGDVVFVIVFNGRAVAIARKGDFHGKWGTAYGSDAMDLGSNLTDVETGAIVHKSITGSPFHGFKLNPTGGIICPKSGVVLLIANAQLGTGFTANDIVHIRIVKNTSHTGPDVSDRVVSTSYGMRSIFTVVNVAKGDVVYARVFNQNGARGTLNANSSTTRITAVYL